MFNLTQAHFDLVNTIHNHFLTTNLSLTTAESCTGGLVSSLITHLPGSSQYFLGGVCSYANSFKQQLLAVPPELLAQYGAVSQEVAEAMAKGCLSQLQADVGLSITGIAGPGGASQTKPLGLVWFGMAYGHQVWSQSHCFSGDREQVRAQAAYTGLQMLSQLFEQGT